MKMYRGIKIKLPLFLDIGTRWVYVVSRYGRFILSFLKLSVRQGNMWIPPSPPHSPISFAT